MDKKIIRAKIDLMLTNPFWGSLITRLELKDWDGPTFATDGKYLMVPDPKHYSNWSFQEIVGVLAHETSHCALGHLFRVGTKIPMKWNVAADFAGNALLTSNNFKLPKGSLLDPKYNGMTAEKIYNSLPDPIIIEIPMDLLEPNTGGKSDDKKKGKGKGKSKKGSEAEGSAPSMGIDPKELEQEWKEATTAAARLAKGRGNMPAGLEDYIDEILFPKVPWQDVLYRYLQVTKGNSDFTAYPFNRRHIWREIYLPSMQGESIELVCAMDTSGSVSKEDLTRYFSELRGICSIFGSYTIYLMLCDSAIHGEMQIITEDEDLKSVVIGRGGTDFRPVFEKIEEEGLEELPLVYFTDLDGYFPDDHHGDGVFWLVRKNQMRYGRAEVPFGEIIEIDD